MKKLNQREIWERLDKLYKRDVKYRGRVLTLSITIEHILSEIISHHFCSNEYQRNLMFSLILTESGLMFKKKILIFKKLMELQYSDLLKKYPELVDSLEDVRDFRNKLAHFMLDTSEETIRKNAKEQINLIYHKNGRKHPITISKDKFFKKWEACNTVIKTLIKVRKEVEQRSKKRNPELNPC